MGKHVDLKCSVEVERVFALLMMFFYKKTKKLKCEEFVINVPIEQRIDKVIACCGWVYAAVFSLSKYGLGPDEISKLTLRHIDL